MPELAQVHIIAVTADTFIDKSRPTQSFELLQHLQVGRYPDGNLSRTFLRFELPAHIANGQIWIASLVLYICKNVYPNLAKEFGVFSVEEDWEPDKVTWNNQPCSKEGIVSSIFIEDEQDCTVEWDITPLIKKAPKKSTWNLEVRSLNEYENNFVTFSSGNNNFSDKQPFLRLVSEKIPAALSEATVQAEDAAKQEYYSSFLKGPFSPESLEILNIINKHRYKAIIIYPELDDDEPHKRAQQLLKELALSGYLCFFCKPTKKDYHIAEIADHLFVLNKQEYLLPILRSQAVVVLCNSILQMSWANLLPHKFLWYDVVSTPSDDNVLEKKLLREANFVTYSANQLKQYLLVRSDAVCLPEEVSQKVASPVDAFEAVVTTMPRGWMIFGNVDARGKINVMTETFLNFEGKDFYSGGAERYLLDLAAICSDLNCTINIYQFGDFPWVRRFRNIDVISLARGSVTTGSKNLVQKFNRLFYEQVQERSILNIYSAFYQAYPLGATPNIGISHGVSWDSPFYKFQYLDQFFQFNSRYLLGAQICQQVVSVDTNTANWFQTIDYKLGQRIKVISNYVDLERFYPKVNFDQVRDKIIILYPRRLYEARGFYLVLEIVDNILAQYPNVEFHFVGKGFEIDTQHVLDKQNKWPGRIKWYSLPPEDMPKAYRSADISLIPTLYSEGTSLSCLEAMACGNAVIASRIGGLTDLIIDQFNGLRIEPNALALEQAIMYLLNDPATLGKFKRNARMVAEAFPKTHWTSEWTKLFKNKIQANINSTSTNTLFIKIYLHHMPDKNSKIGYLITALLSRGYLIYILVKNMQAHPELSFGRIQWVGWQDEEFATPNFTMADQEIIGDLNQKVQLILTESWLERFCGSPENILTELQLT